MTLKTLEEGDDSPSKPGGTSGRQQLPPVTPPPVRAITSGYEGGDQSALSFRFATTTSDQSPPPSPLLLAPAWPRELTFSSGGNPDHTLNGPKESVNKQLSLLPPPPTSVPGQSPWMQGTHNAQQRPPTALGRGLNPGANPVPRTSEGEASVSESLSGNLGGCCSNGSRCVHIVHIVILITCLPHLRNPVVSHPCPTYLILEAPPSVQHPPEPSPPMRHHFPTGGSRQSSLPQTASWDWPVE